MRNEFKYCCIFLFLCCSAYWGYKYYFPDKFAYIEDDTYIYHSTPVCDEIRGLHVMEVSGNVMGSKKVDEKDVYYDQKYRMCPYCFSPIEIEYRDKYINR